MGAHQSRGQIVNALEVLKKSEVAPDDHDFWDDFWSTKTSAEEIFMLIGPEEVRTLRQKSPRNLVTLFTQAVAQLCTFVQSPTPVYFDQALNCCRVLQRLLPFLLENPDDDLVKRLCWSTDDVDPADGAAANPGANPNPSDDKEPLASLIVHACMHLLFLPGFTVDLGAFEIELDDADNAHAGGFARWCEHPAAMWVSGLGVPKELVVTQRAFDLRRIEVLRLVMAALCDPLYATPEAFDPSGSPWLGLATDVNTPNAGLLFFSLLATVLGYDPIGLGIPYGSAFSTDVPLKLSEKALHCLLILLDHTAASVDDDPPPSPDEGVDSTDQAPAPPPAAAAQSPNVYRQMLGSLAHPDEFDYLFEGFATQLGSLPASASATLTGAFGTVEYHQELLILLWKLYEENPAFLDHCLRRCDATRLVGPLCYLMNEARKDPARVGLLHTCTFILLKMSGERPFCVGCSAVPYANKLPTDLPLFTGNHCDLLVVTLHQIVVQGGTGLTSLYNCFLTVLCNMSPYCTSLSLVASVKLVALFDVFTHSALLFGNEAHGAYVALLLETFANIVQYQYSGNSHMVYALVGKVKTFEAFAALDAAGAVAASRAAFRCVGGGSAASTASGAPETKGGEAGDDGAAVEMVEADPASSPPFVPTQAWLDETRPAGPFSTVLRLVQHMTPQVETFCQVSVSGIDEKAILEFIRSTTMVGLLPVPHPIVIRKYQRNKLTAMWYTAYMWGVLFLQNQNMPMFDGAMIRLFTVSAPTLSGRAGGNFKGKSLEPLEDTPMDARPLTERELAKLPDGGMGDSHKVPETEEEWKARGRAGRNAL